MPNTNVIKNMLNKNTSIDDLVKKLHPSEIARLLSSTPMQDRLVVWNNLSTKTKAIVVTELGEDIRVGLLEQTPINELVEATTHLDLDDLTDLLQDLPEHLMQIILQSMERQNRQQVETALSYPEDTAGGLMNPDSIKIRTDVTIDVVHRYIRKLGKLPIATSKLMVVDRNDYFLGTLQIVKVLTEDPDAKVAQFINHNSIAINVNTKNTIVADLFRNRDLISAPVVDDNNKLLGRITIDDVVDVIQEDAGQVIMSRDGLDEEDDIFSGVLQTAKRRNLWLGVHLVAAFLSTSIIGLFENSIQQFISLAILMPLIASISGVAGSQTLTLTIRGMTLNQINANNAIWLLRKELLAGALNGLILGAIIALVAYFWFDNKVLSLVVLLTILLNITLAAILGVIIPIAQKRLNIDPVIAGHVALTAVTDAVAFLSFLGLATLLLN